jgi:hypothetical protein
MAGPISVEIEITRDIRWRVADGEIFANITGLPGWAGPVIAHLSAVLDFGDKPTPTRPFDPFVERREAPFAWGRHLSELLGDKVIVVLSAPLPRTDRSVTAFVDIDGAKVNVSLGATTKRARAALRAVIIEAIDGMVCPADEHHVSDDRGEP